MRGVRTSELVDRDARAVVKVRFVRTAVMFRVA